MSKNKILILIILFISTITEDCSNFNGEYPCQGDQREYDKSWDERSFQTPPRGTPNYRDSYQDMNLIVEYAAEGTAHCLHLVHQSVILFRGLFGG